MFLYVASNFVFLYYIFYILYILYIIYIFKYYSLHGKNSTSRSTNAQCVEREVARAPEWRVRPAPPTFTLDDRRDLQVVPLIPILTCFLWFLRSHGIMATDWIIEYLSKAAKGVGPWDVSDTRGHEISPARVTISRRLFLPQLQSSRRGGIIPSPAQRVLI